MSGAMSAPIAKSTRHPATHPDASHREASELRATRSGHPPTSHFRRALGGSTSNPAPRAGRALGDPSAPMLRADIEQADAARPARRAAMSDADLEGETDDGASDSREASIEPVALMEMDLAPFRVNHALQPMRSAAPDPVRHDQTASMLASELVESMRVGRFGRDGHAVSMRIRTPSGVIGVELREEEGSLRMALDGASDAELDALSDRVRRALRDRGIELS